MQTRTRLTGGMVVCVALASSTAAARGPTPPTYDEVVYAIAPTDLGGTTSLTLDIYKPAGVTTPTPVVLWIHGGGWQSGTHNNVPAGAQALLARGIAVASVGYRLSGTSIFPAQIHDVKGAARFLRANAGTFGLDTNRMGAWGSSAGGHLTALLATSADVAAIEGTIGGNLGYSSRVFAAVDYFGPTDLLNINLDVTTPPGSSLNHDSPDSPESHLIGFDGPGEGLGVLRANQNNPAAPYPDLMQLVSRANPLTHVSADDPAIFIAHGTNDTVVPIRQSVRLFDALSAARVNTSYTPVTGAGHGSLGTTTDTAADDFLASQLLPVAGLVNWNNPFGGDWSSSGNWHGGALPTTTSDVIFNFNANYASSITQSLTCARSLSVGRGNVALDLNGNTLALTGSLTIGRTSGPRASLSASGGGTLSTGNIFVGGSAIATAGMGTLIIGDATTLKVGGTLRVWNNGTVVIDSGGSVSAATISVASGGHLLLAGNAEARALRLTTLANAGTIDLANNAMVASNTPRSVIESQIKFASHDGAWDRPGVTSSAARDNPTGNTTLGTLSGQEYLDRSGASTFDGVTVNATDVLVNYTYFGDVDFNGQIDASDYNLIDFGFASHLTGWANGDADYSGSVDVSDYNLIDFAFSTQNGTIHRAIRYLDGTDRSADGMNDDPSLQKVTAHFAQFGESYASGFLAAVPEPATATIGVISLATLMAKRRRRRPTSAGAC